jgi:hypothetical protein
MFLSELYKKYQRKKNDEVKTIKQMEKKLLEPESTGHAKKLNASIATSRMKLSQLKAFLDDIESVQNQEEIIN